MSQIKQKLEIIFKEIFEDDNLTISDHMTSENIESWDSLNHVKLILACEDEFKIKFDVQEINELDKIKDLIDLINKKLSN